MDVPDYRTRNQNNDVGRLKDDIGVRISARGWWGAPAIARFILLMIVIVPVHGPGSLAQEDPGEGATAPDRIPSARITADPGFHGRAPIDINFSGEESRASDGEIESYHWRFGDGSTAGGREVQRSYQDTGIPQRDFVELRVTDEQGYSASSVHRVYIAPGARTAEISTLDSWPAGAEPGAVILFTSAVTLPASGVEGLVYRWDFGDGEHESDALPAGVSNRPVRVTASHSYSAPGDYMVALTILDAYDSELANASLPLVIGGNEAPIAAFTITPDSVSGSTAMLFDASMSEDPDGKVLGYQWDFGDGATGSGMRVSHEFPGPGAYPVRLTAWDDAGKAGSTMSQVFVGSTDGLPVASFTASSLSGTAPLSITVDGRASRDDGVITSYRWDFGDGGTGLGPVANHEYAVPGSYLLSLTVRDDDGNLDHHEQAIDVGVANIPPEAVIGATAFTGEVPLEVHFSASESVDADGYIAQYQWHTRDGAILHGANVSHVYHSPGSHRVTLTVTDDGGASASESVYIVAGLPHSPIPDETPTMAMQNPLDLGGSADPDVDVRVYVNDFLIAETRSDEFGRFNVSVPLDHGINTIEMTALVHGEESVRSIARVVDFENRLAAEQGGTVIDSTVVWGQLPGGAHYRVESGDLRIEPGGELVLLPGVTVAFGNGNALRLNGGLRAIGSAERKVTLTSAKVDPGPGDWQGIVISVYPSSGRVQLENAVVEYGENCLSVYNAVDGNLVLRNTEIRHCLRDGVYTQDLYGGVHVEDSHIHSNGRYGVHVPFSNRDPLIAGNLLENNRVGIFAVGGDIRSEAIAPFGSDENYARIGIEDNEIRHNQTGIELRWRTRAQILGNDIHHNGTGVALHGDDDSGQLHIVEPPAVIAHDNNIHDNFDQGGSGIPRRINLLTEGRFHSPEDDPVNLDFQRNWWGSANPADVADAMDRRDTGRMARPDYGLFLDDVAGEGEPFTYSLLAYLDPGTILAGDGVYVVPDTLVIPAGAGLGIRDEVRLEFATATPGYHDSEDPLNYLVVHGELDIGGGIPGGVQLYGAGNIVPAWGGIKTGTGALVDIERASIRGAYAGLWQQGAGSQVRIVDSELRNNRAGVLVLAGESLEVRDSRITGNEHGVVANYRIIPTQVAGSDIYGNTVTGIGVLERYGDWGFVTNPGNHRIQAGENWWGGPSPVVTSGIPSPASDVHVDSEEYLEWIDLGTAAGSAIHSGLVGDVAISAEYLSPNADGRNDEMRVSGCFPGTGQWLIRLVSIQGHVIREWSGSAQCPDIAWDGSMPDGDSAPNGEYTLLASQWNPAELDPVVVSIIRVNASAPSLAVPGDIVVEASAIETVVHPGEATAMDAFGGILEAEAGSAGPFPPGVHEIPWTVEDAWGNRSSGVQTITVVDTTPPVVTPPQPVLEFGVSAKPIDLPVPEVDDIFPVEITNDAPDVFPPGITTVTWTASDPYGNTATVEQVVEVADIAVTVDTANWPQETNRRRILVSGSIRSPRNSGVLVNDEVAAIDFTRFPYGFSSYVELEPGINEISIQASAIGGLTADASLLVTREGEEVVSHYTVAVDTHSGVIPFDVTYTIEGVGNGQADTVWIDLDGDGEQEYERDVSELRAGDVLEVGVPIQDPGSYDSVVTIREEDGDIHYFENTIVGVDGMEYVAISHEIWDSFHGHLLAGDVETAETYLSVAMAAKYRQAIMEILDQFPAIITSYSFFEAIWVTPGMTGFLVNRIEGGETYAYLVYFGRGQDGVWKLISM